MEAVLRFFELNLHVLQVGAVRRDVSPGTPFQYVGFCRGKIDDIVGAPGCVRWGNISASSHGDF